MTILPYEAALYFNQMVEVKRRFLAIDRILGAKKSRTLSEDTDNEFMWLQIRNIIELVTYSGIASDRDRYKALRAAQNGGKVEDDQKATRILKRLDGISTKFMPLPIGQMIAQADGSKHFTGLDEVQQTTLTNLTDLFNQASDHLHTANPFVTDAQDLKLALREESRARVIEAHKYLKTALWEHYKVGLEFKSGDDPKLLDNPKGVYIVCMGKPEVPAIQMHLADRKD
jgi:hypothetical protein